MLRLAFLLLVIALPLATAVEIPLPPGVQVEGVAHLAGSNFLASDIRRGAVYLVDVKTGLITTAVPATAGRLAIGTHATKEMIFVAGGGNLQFSLENGEEIPTPALYVYDTVTGSTLAECEIPNGGFVNDVTADDQFAYYTDSFRRFIYKLRLKNVSECDVTRIRLPRPAFKNENGVFRANGIVRYKDGLIVANSFDATLYYADLTTKKFSAIFPTGSLLSPDGLELVQRKRESLLYVAQNAMNKVSEWKLDMDKTGVVSATLVRNITSSEFNIPTTVAVNGRTLVVPNSRFGEVMPSDPLNSEEQFTLSVLKI